MGFDIYDYLKFDNDPNASKVATGESSYTSLVDSLDELIQKSQSMVTSTSQVDIIRGFNYNRDALVVTDKDSTGYTFFGRPILNMTNANVMASRMLQYYNVNDPNSVAFAIRCILDPFLQDEGTYAANAVKSPLFNPKNPFIPVLTNRLKNISGFPDMVMETETTEGGYFSEDISIAKGWDNLNKSYDISATFSDVRGGFILALFMAWFIWMDLAIKGPVVPYKRFIEDRVICYTLPIYRFLMDESNTYITKWAKATGCIPLSIPMGAYFNFDITNPFVYEGNNLTIPFKVAGGINYMDPIVLVEFNMLIQKFYHDINSKNVHIYTKSEMAESGTTLMPYIDLKSGYNELLWVGDAPKKQQTFLEKLSLASRSDEKKGIVNKTNVTTGS